jgi:hypothetical protein
VSCISVIVCHLEILEGEIGKQTVPNTFCFDVLSALAAGPTKNLYL